jgi:hypothetical protein
MMSDVNRDKVYNEAPWSQMLANLVKAASHRDNWIFELKDMDRGQGCTGLTLEISVLTPNSYNHSRLIGVRHLFPVPAAAYNYRSWRRWLFERVLLVERHEAMEFFTIAGEKPYAPHHGPGEDPYTVYEHGSETDVKTSFRGELND